MRDIKHQIIIIIIIIIIITILFLFLQLVVEVYDSKYPANRDRQTLTVSVRVNPNAPIFYDNGRPTSFYDVTVNETESIGKVIKTIFAEDPDNVSFFVYSKQMLR